MRTLLALLRSIPDVIADKLDRWLLFDVHRAHEAAPDMWVCTHHRRAVEWPCPDAEQARERILARHKRTH